MWKRRTAELAYHWGTINLELFEDPRPEYHGVPGRDPVTGRIQPQYSSSVRLMKIYFVSGPIMIILLFLLFGTMLLFLECENHINSFVHDGDSPIWRLIKLQFPSTCYVVVIMVFTTMYRWIAVKLTNWGMYLIVIVKLSIPLLFNNSNESMLNPAGRLVLLLSVDAMLGIKM